MLLDILVFGVENNTDYLEKTVLLMWSHTCDKMAKIVRKTTQKKKKFVKFGLSWGKFWPLRTL